MLWKALRAVGIGVLVALLALPAILCENSLHIQPSLRPVPQEEVARAVARVTGSSWQAVQIVAADGVPLRGWWFSPPDPAGAVILLHGVADTRQGMLAHARFLLQHGFAALLPDCRGHGSSGGELISYGIQEAADVHRWADWMCADRHADKLYGIGQSMGAAILLQSLPVERRFRAVVADCPFASFEEISYDRMAQIAHLPRFLAWPVLQEGFLYARLAHHLDLRRMSPAAAVRAATVPILLIHGAADNNIPPRHSRMLHALNPRDTRLWEVAGAGHAASLGAQPEAYARMVVEWFTQH